MAITITDTAQIQIRSFLESRGSDSGLRIGVQTTGCSGLGYVLEFADNINPSTEGLYDVDGINILIDPKSLGFMEGTEVDYVKEGLNEGFKFNNPKAKAECGCGESFTV